MPATGRCEQTRRSRNRSDLLVHSTRCCTSEFDRTIAAYRALETLLADGRVRAGGEVTLWLKHLKTLREHTDIVPAVNQIEVHPYFTQPAVRKHNAQWGIVTQAWSPIGGITAYGGRAKTTFDDKTIGAIAAEHGRTPAQIMLAWHLQEGRSAIPKSVAPTRIAENFDVLDIELSPRPDHAALYGWTRANVADQSPKRSPSRASANPFPKPNLWSASAFDAR